MKWIENTSVGNFFDNQADKMPEKTAVINLPNGEGITFGEVKHISDRLARGMIDLGVKKNDKVAVWTNNIPEWIFLLLALSKIGATMVPLNPNIRVRDLHYDLLQADVKFLFLIESCNGADYVNVLHQAVPDLEILSRGCVQSKRLPNLKQVFVIGDRSSSKFASFSDVMSRADKVSDDDFRSVKEQVLSFDTVIIKFTCGLTGYPRGAELTHFGLINNALPIVEKLKFGSSDTLCLPLPFHYIFGFWMGLMVAFSSLSSMVIMPKYSAADVLKAIAQHGCTALYGVPTMFTDLLNHPDFSTFDLRSLRTGMISGDFCPPKLIERIITTMAIPELTTAYGITEIGLLTQTGCEESIPKAIETIGQPLEGMEMKVINPDTGELLPSGEQGEICVRTSMMMKGYYNMDSETAELVDSEGWFHTGDLGTRDEEGYYLISGRRRNMVIRGGENIYPLEIEKFLCTYPGAVDARVVGVPSRRLSEEVYAFVKMNKNSDVDAQSIREYCRTQISRHQTPRWIKIVERFPGEEEGAIDRNELRRSALEELGLQEDSPMTIIYND
ncbi:MAG: AMP-binding protein [Deltaproteobacteria bacterium]|nr:AMP-binding protein [Deltaproteobacteria bacterium]